MPVAENLTYIELDISENNGVLPLLRDWRVTYYIKYTGSQVGQAEMFLRDKVYVDGDMPDGYTAIAVRQVSKSSTQFQADTHSGKQNLNESSFVRDLKMTGYEPASYISVQRLTGVTASANEPAYYERTITYAIMPVGCVPTQE